MTAGEEEEYRGIFFVNERRPEQSLSIFIDRKRAGAKALCIVRRQHDHAALEQELQEVERYWLLLRYAQNAIRPSDLDKIDSVICSFLQKNRGGVVLLDGFETLMLFNDYSKISKLVGKAKSLADSSGSAIIIPVDSRALYREDFENISENFKVIDIDKAEKR
ncbi:MAG: DUF835 domain-containing protein [Methanobacteriota archaeon]|nr:MAG: DUF835 domain-containing protein [Euryarchaeota archaeon]